MVLVTAAAVVLGIGIIAFANRPSGPSGGDLTVPPTAYSADQVDGDVLGSASAPVVMQLYADFQCPACKLFVTQQLPRLMADFIQPGTLRIEAQDIAFLGRGSPDESVELAAGAACAADQNRYWQFHDFVFWNQGRENRGDHNADFIARVAEAAEVDRTAWDACLARDDVRTAVESATQVALGAGVSSTPTVIVNGQSLPPGVPSYDQLAALIRQLAAASPAPGAASPAASTPAASGATPS